jgi:hypothetical protein
MLGVGRRFVYILRGESDPTRHYVGVATDVDEPLRAITCAAEAVLGGASIRRSDS